MASPTSSQFPRPASTSSSGMQCLARTDVVTNPPVVQVGKNSLCLVETSDLSESDNSMRTEKGDKYPQQINSIIGGYMKHPELPLNESVMTSIRNKFFLNAGGDQNPVQIPGRQIIEDLCRTIEHGEGWANQLCVHTSEWENDDGSEGQMCFMTAVKHIACSDGELEKI